MKNQNSSFNDTKFKNSNNASRVQNANKSVHNQNQYDSMIKNSKNVNIAHFDAKVLVYVWFISFLSVLFLAVAGYLILDNKIQRQADNFNSFVAGLLNEPQVLK